MCGRMNVSDHEGVREFLTDLDLPLEWSLPDAEQSFAAGHNIAPGSALKVIHAVGQQYRQTIMQWGIAPPWKATKQNNLPNRLMYARAETVWEKQSFSSLISSQRLVIPVNGFYEWRRDAEQKLPFYFCGQQSKVLLLAGLFTITKENQYQCCVLTNAAGILMVPVHHRSPVLIDEDSLESWLRNNDPQILNQIMANSNELSLSSVEVSSYVNSTSNEGALCIAPKLDGVEPTQSSLF